MSNGGTKPRFEGGRPRARSGRAAPLALVLALALVAGGGLLALTGIFSPPPRPVASPAAPVTAEEGQETPLPPERLDTGAGGRIEVGEVLPYKDLPRSFEGRGQVTGVVEVVGEQPFPKRWTLVLEPSKFGTGREHAARRVKEFEGDTRTFDESDLPLGGYTVSVQAEGLNSRPQELLLFAIPGSPTGGKTRAHLILHLTPSGFMDGSVRDAQGTPVGDLPVFLENLSDKQVVESMTTAAGTWRFDGLRDGRYRLCYGSVERPLIPARDLTYSAPQRQLTEDEVPVTGSVAFYVLDKTGLAVMDARVMGFGRPGGQIVSTSGPDGIARARFLPGGRYQVKADHAADRLEGKADFILEGNEVDHPVQVVLYPTDQ